MGQDKFSNFIFQGHISVGQKHSLAPTAWRQWGQLLPTDPTVAPPLAGLLPSIAGSDDHYQPLQSMNLTSLGSSYLSVGSDHRAMLVREI